MRSSICYLLIFCAHFSLQLSCYDNFFWKGNEQVSEKCHNASKCLKASIQVRMPVNANHSRLEQAVYLKCLMEKDDDCDQERHCEMIKSLLDIRSMNLTSKCSIRCCKKNYCNSRGKHNKKHHHPKNLRDFEPTRHTVTTNIPTTSTVNETSTPPSDFYTSTAESTSTSRRGDPTTPTTSLGGQANKTATPEVSDHGKLLNRATKKAAPVGEKSRDTGSRGDEAQEDYSMPSLLIMVPCVCVFGIIVSLIAWKLIKKS